MDESSSKSGASDRWGHLRPGEYRYRFEAREKEDFRGKKRGLLDEASSLRSSEKENEEDDEESNALSALYKAARTASITGQVTESVGQGASLVSRLSREAARRTSAALDSGGKRGSKILDQGLNALSEKLQKGSQRKNPAEACQDSESDTEERPQTPDWARSSGLIIQTVGSLYLQADPRLAVAEESDDRKTLPTTKKSLEPWALRTVVSFLNPRTVALTAMLNKEWSQAGYTSSYLYPDVSHLGNCTVRSLAHAGRVDSVMIYPPHNLAILSSGDKRVLAWDSWESGRGALETQMRDTVYISHVFAACGSLWTASKNGCLREYALAHELESIEFRSQFWEHTAQINDCTTSELCDCFAGIQSTLTGVRHRPKLLSSSDDRTVRVWNIDMKRCDAVIKPFSHRCATMRSIAVSDQHIYIGASDGCVYVYSATSKSRRLANKKKKRLGVHAIFPLEIELQCGNTVISAIRTTKASLKDMYHSQVFVASWDGSLRIWAVPENNLDFRLLYTLSTLHSDRITALHISNNYFITASDDQTIRFHGRYHKHLEMSLERVLHVGGRVKCLAVAQAPTAEYAGTLAYGLSNGIVAVHSLGYSI